MKILRWLALGGAFGAAAYWLNRYLRPEHSPLVLNNSVVVITGASSGLGRAYANAFARRGARIVLAARRVELLEEVRHEIAPYAADVLVVPTDVRDDVQLEALVQQTLARFGQLDLLIANAGLVEYGTFHGHDPARIRAMVDTNLASTMCLTRFALPSMLARRSGIVVIVSSIGGILATPIQPAYASTKAGEIAFSQVLRRSLFGTGVEVILVLPSWTYSEMVPPPVEQAAREMGFGVDAPDFVAERTIDGILQGQHEILFGDQLARAGAWLFRHFPLLGDMATRFAVTPKILAQLDGISNTPAVEKPR